MTNDNMRPKKDEEKKKKRKGEDKIPKTQKDTEDKVPDFQHEVIVNSSETVNSDDSEKY